MDTDLAVPMDPDEALAILGSLDIAERRLFLTRPGESLLLSANVRDMLDRADGFQTAAGLDPSDIIVTPALTIPFPVYDFADTDAGKWPGTNPAFLWHPLAWLPPRLNAPLEVYDDEGTTSEETDPEWAFRVALEMTASGLFNPATGWVDILALYGLDTTNPVDAARVSAWAAGGADLVLDGIDLTPFFAATDTTMGDELWGLRRATDIFPAYQVVSWSVTARTILSDLTANPVDRLPAGERQQAWATTAAVAADFLTDIPDLDGLGGQNPQELLDDVYATLENAWDERAVDTIRTVLAAVAETFAAEEENLIRAEQTANQTSTEGLL